MHFSSKLLLKFKIDDPLEAAPMHGFCGAFGVLWVGFMAKKEWAEVYGLQSEVRSTKLAAGNSARKSSVSSSSLAWTCGTIGPFFMLMKKLNLLRITAEEETLGLDESKHGGKAYQMELVAPEPA